MGYPIYFLIAFLVQNIFECKIGGWLRYDFFKGVELGRGGSITKGLPCLVCSYYMIFSSSMAVISHGEAA